MNPDKIIVVSGEPRSGTSLMMQTLKELGMPITGSAKPQEDKLKSFKDENGEWLPEYFDKKDDIERRLRHSEMMNPVGFYETEYVSRGIRGVEAEKYKGKVMKIITSGIPEHYGRNGMVGTSKKLIDKIVLCVRNPKSIAISQKNLIDDKVLVAGKEGDGWVYHNDAPPSPLAYISRTGYFVMWLEDNLDIIKDILVVEYEDMHSNPKEEIQRVIDFFGINPTDEQIQCAIKNVRPQLRRSIDFDEWPENFKEDGELSMCIYNAIKSLLVEDITYVSALLQSRQIKNKFESVRWVDDDNGHGLWIDLNSSLYRNISINKNNLKNNLMKNADYNNCTKCKYRIVSDKTYTIQRPVDLGDLVRNMILCERDRDLRTVEQCYHCYSLGWTLNGEYIKPARVILTE